MRTFTAAVLMCVWSASGAPPIVPSAPGPALPPLQRPQAQPPKAPARNLPVAETAELERELGRFLGVFTAALDNAADAVDPAQAIYAGALPGMLRELDPHSIFFNPDQFEQMKEMQRSVVRGFGSVVSLVPGQVIVLQTQPGSPAARAGLAPGDEILALNDVALARLDLPMLVELLGYSRQHPVRLVVRRQGTAGLLTFTMVPAEMQAESVDRVYKLDEGTGYLRLTSFEAETGAQVKAALAKLEENDKLGGAGLQRLVLDLRDNPGGMVNAGFEVASLFLKPGTLLLTARGRSAESESVVVPKEFQPHYDCRLAVLVNGKTASAAEIVAGALQDHDRAVIVGEPTFGKGLVQRVFSLHEDTGLALTTAFYYTPSGRSLQRPLHAGALTEATANATRPAFKTDSGRTVLGGGGIEPDIFAAPEPATRFGVYLEASGAYLSFATRWLSQHRAELNAELQITPSILDEFRDFLSERNARPGIAEWTAEGEQMRSRLKQSILDQGLGVKVGDEVEVRRDPVVRQALERLTPK